MIMLFKTLRSEVLIVANFFRGFCALVRFLFLAFKSSFSSSLLSESSPAMRLPHDGKMNGSRQYAITWISSKRIIINAYQIKKFSIVLYVYH
jgi:hypothetical protein